MGMGFILGNAFTNSSGHPVERVSSDVELTLKLFWGNPFLNSSDIFYIPAPSARSTSRVGNDE
jgi:hypothetical protein